MKYQAVERRALSRRSRVNVRINMGVALVLFALGTASVCESLMSKKPENVFMEFRYMTLNGTIFTTLISLLIFIICAFELRGNIALESSRLYYLRLSSAVTETIIAMVVMMSFFPFVPDNPNIFTFSSFSMHVVIPLLSIVSFLMNRSPVKPEKPFLRLNCSWLITLYAATVITLIVLGFIPQEKIPYSFLDFQTRPVWYMLYFGCFIYSLTFILSYLYTDWNHWVSLIWKEKKPISPVTS